MGEFDEKNCFGPVETGEVDAVAFGKWFISNPDLVGRLRKGRGLAGYRKETFYVRGRKGVCGLSCFGERRGRDVRTRRGHERRGEGVNGEIV